MPIRRPVIQHSIRRSMYPGAQINTLLKTIANDMINIELESITEASVRSMRKSTLKCNCRLRQKKLLRHGNCSNKYTKQEIDMQNILDETDPKSYQRDNAEEEPEIPENGSLIEMSDINVESDIIAPEINQENLEMEIEHLENNLEYVVPEFEAPGNYSNYFAEEIESPENKSENDEETEQESQGNDDLKIGYDNEQNIEHAQILDANDEHAQILQANEEAAVTKPNDKLKIEILENIVIKHASKSHAEILQTIRDIIVLKKGIGFSKVDSMENVTTQEIKVVYKNNANKQINDGKDKILQANNEIVSKQTNSNVEGIHNIDPKNNEPTTENTSTKTRETEIIVVNKSDSETTEKVPQFDNFKVPKKVTRLKKKTIKKQQPRFVLTHVVGGHIIQESNFAFPIREPQSQKNQSQSSNTEVTAPPIEVKQEENVVQDESGTKETAPTEVKEEETVDQEESGIKEPVATEVKEAETVVQEESVTEETVPLTDGNEEEIEYVQRDVANGEFNPFARLQQSTVKSWTVEDLSNHLLEFNWEETASLLQDNEIDGASLFMVTKTQLMIIGVNEEQADVISEFVQSGLSRGN